MALPNHRLNLVKTATLFADDLRLVHPLRLHNLAASRDSEPCVRVTAIAAGAPQRYTIGLLRQDRAVIEMFNRGEPPIHFRRSFQKNADRKPIKRSNR